VLLDVAVGTRVTHSTQRWGCLVVTHGPAIPG
jgi:hypothetical protein